MEKSKEVKQLEEQLSECQEMLGKQQDMLTKLMSPPLRYAMVINAESPTKFACGKTITVRTDNGDVKEIFRPDMEISNGQMLLINPETSQAVAEAATPNGSVIVSVKRMITESKCEVTMAGESVIVFSGGHQLQEGDRAVLNERFQVITGKMAIENGYDIDTNMEIGWDDIGGLTNANRS